MAARSRAVGKKGRRASAPHDAALFAAKPKERKIPFAFVLDELERVGPVTRPMFGCTAVYAGDKIVLILRDSAGEPQDNGVWIATTKEHHASLRREMPSLRSIAVLGGGGETGWQVIPKDAVDFEDSALLACALVLRGDARVGKVPKPKKPKGSKRG